MKPRSGLYIACLAFSYIQIVTSLSSLVRVERQHCLSETVVLLSNIGCSTIGEIDILSLVGRDTSPILVDTQRDQKSASDLTTWSYKPLCTNVLREINDRLCVYTNASFGNGRGVSIFTTPGIAAHFVTLPVNQNPTVFAEINKATGAWYTKSLPGRGIGMLAKQALKRGDLITAYTPVLIVYMEAALSTMEREKYLRVAIEQLPPKTRIAYQSLATIYGDAETIIQDVLKANTFEVQIGGHRHMAVFPETSRINHDCGPKYVITLSESLNMSTVLMD